MPLFLFMGLFSETKTYVNAVSAKLITETPDIKKAGVLTSILQGRDIGPDLTDSYMQGIFIKARRYFRYGRDHYYHGLPDGNQGLVNVQDYIVGPIIQAEVGFEIVIISNVIDTCDSNYFAYSHLRDNRGWNPDDNTTTYKPVGSVGVVKFVTSIFESVTQVLITYADTENNPFTETLTVSGAKLDVPFYHVIYTKKGESTGTRYYWNYDTTSGVHPELTPKAGSELLSPYYPIAPVRENNITMAVTEAPKFDSEGVETSPGTPFWLSARSLCKKLGLDYKNLGESVDKNPGINEIDHAYIILGVDILTDEQPGMTYLHDYFTYLYGLNPSSKPTFDHSISLGSENPNPPKGTIITIKDSTYHVDLGYTWITNDIKSGVLGIIGTCTKQISNIGSIKRKGYSFETTELTFRKQITATTYSETTTAGLTHTNHIYVKYTVDSTVASASEVDGEGDRINKNFVVPLNYAITNNMKFTVANDLMYESIWLVFNSHTEVELKWYQTSFFQFVIIVVAIAISIISYNPGALTQALTGVSISTAGAGLALAVVSDLLVAYALQLSFGLIADKLGPEIALIAGIALTIYTMRAPLGLTGAGPVAGLPFVTSALNLATNVMDGLIEIKVGDIQEDMEAEKERQQQLTGELELKMEELAPRVNVDPLDLINDMGDNFSYQSVENYYYQKIHSGNVGVATLQSVNSYVENTLTLPTTSNSLGVNINV
jgi:hypothetical protein